MEREKYTQTRNIFLCILQFFSSVETEPTIRHEIAMGQITNLKYCTNRAIDFIVHKDIKIRKSFLLLSKS